MLISLAYLILRRVLGLAVILRTPTRLAHRCKQDEVACSPREASAPSIAAMLLILCGDFPQPLHDVTGNSQTGIRAERAKEVCRVGHA